MNGWLDGGMTNLSYKKKKKMPAGMHIRVIMNKEKGKNNIKKENQSTQKEIPLTP